MNPSVRFPDLTPGPALDAQVRRIRAEIDARATVRTFDTGASRDTDEGKLDFEAFFSPLVFECYGEFMHKNRVMKDGSLRDGDNWQKGIPKTVYMKSLWRHFFDAWKILRGYPCKSSLRDALCGILFNTQGLLHEDLKTETIR